MSLQIKRAVRQKKKLRIAADGPSGSGKSYSMIRLAHAMIARGLATKLLVVDSERDSASLYAGSAPDGTPWEFDCVQLTSYAPTEYTAAIKLGERHGYDVILIDSLSHAWEGEGGALDLVDRKSTGNNFTAWKDVTPLHRRMVDAILQSSAHVLVTMRTKTEWVLEADHRGKMVPRRVGTKSVQREGMEYEFDLFGRLDTQHQIHVEKTRCDPMDGASAVKPGPAFWEPLFDWHAGGADAAARVVAADDRTADERDRDEFARELSAVDPADPAAGDQLADVVDRLKARNLPAHVKKPLAALYSEKAGQIAQAQAADRPAAAAP